MKSHGTFATLFWEELKMDRFLFRFVLQSMENV